MRRPLSLAALLLSAPMTLAFESWNRNLAKLPGPFNANATQRMYYSVLFSGLFIDGEKSTMTPFRNTTLGKPAEVATYGMEGLPQLQADYDYATVSVKRNMSVPTPATAVSTQLVACYAKASLFDRGWRKPNNNTELDKQCPWFIADLPVNGGNATWNISPETPKSIIFLRAYQMCKAPDEDQLVVCAFANSPGVVQVKPIETHPKNLIAGAIICLFIGPLCIVGWYVYESKFKKWA